MLGGFQCLKRLEHVLDAILLHKRRAEESFDRGVESHRIIVRNHVCRVWEDAELAVGDVLVDLQRVRVSDHIVIARQNERGRRDRLKRLGVDVRLVEHHLRHLQLAPALWGLPGIRRYRVHHGFYQGEDFRR